MLILPPGSARLIRAMRAHARPSSTLAGRFCAKRQQSGVGSPGTTGANWQNFAGVGEEARLDLVLDADKARRATLG